jgi:hypothetical protein
MCRATLALGILIAAASPSSLALADPAVAAPASSAPLPPGSVPVAPAVGSAPAATPLAPASADVAGVAVVALAGAADAAWPLAQAVYGTPSLRPPTVGEPRARALCGEVMAADAPSDLRDLAAMVAALHGDDAPSRAVLADIGRRLALRAVVMVRLDAEQHATARVFLADAGVFDAATYTPDEASPPSWSGAMRSLVRMFGAAPVGAAAPGASASAGVSAGVVVRAPELATHEAPRADDAHHRQFYESGWFWGALGAAAFAGGAVFLATRDSSPSTIHLQIEVPH